MDTSSLSAIGSFTVSSLLITAIICVAAVFTVWYTCRTQIKLSQVIAGAFGYLAYMLLSATFSALLPESSSAVALAVGWALLDVVCIELIRFLMTKYALMPRFQNADAAIGYALGFAGLYLIFSCALYYFSCYTTVHAYLSAGADSFFASLSQEEAESAFELLSETAARSGFSYLLTAVNRVFYLLRHVFLSVLIWYGLTDGKKRFWLAAAPVLHILAIMPESLFNAGVITDTMVRDIAVCVLSGAIIFLGALEYRAHENAVSHFKMDRLRARRRR